MDGIIRKLGKYSKHIGMISFFAATVFCFIFNLGGFGGGFMPVIGNLIILAFSVALVGVVPLSIVLKKDNYLPYAFGVFFIYWILSSVFNYIGDSYMISEGWGGLSIAFALFETFIGCALLAVIVLCVLFFFKKKARLLQYAFCILVCSFVFYLVVWSLYIARCAKNDFGWTSYLYSFYEYIFLPLGVAFVSLHLLLDKVFVSTEKHEDFVQQIPVAFGKRNDFEPDYVFSEPEVKKDFEDEDIFKEEEYEDEGDDFFKDN